MDANTIKLFGSKATDHWQTPLDLKQKLGVVDYYDPCPRNPTEDGLSVDWKRFTFVNPPYSQVIKWFAKAHNELIKGNCGKIVFLVFANTDTNWFWQYCYNDDSSCDFPHCSVDIKFLRGRVKFIPDSGKLAPAMRPSMIVTFNRK